MSSSRLTTAEPYKRISPTLEHMRCELKEKQPTTVLTLLLLYLQPFSILGTIGRHPHEAEKISDATCSSSLAPSCSAVLFASFVCINNH